MSAYDDIRAERARQDLQWGGPAHDDGHAVEDWCSYIGRQLYFVEVRPPVRDRLVKIAALAVAAIESLDRQREAQP